MAKKRAMVKKTTKRGSSDKKIFNAGWIISLILAFGISFGQVWATYNFWTLILVALGVIMGIAHPIKRVEPLILMAVALAIFSGSSLAVIPIVGAFLSDLVTLFMSFLTPAALIIALRELKTLFN